MEKRLKRTAEIIIFVFVLCILGGILFRYYGNTPSPFSSIKSWITSKSEKKQEAIVVNCNKDEIKIDVPGGSLCRNKIEPSVYVDIFDKYPLKSDGKGTIYRSTSKGSIEVADKILNNEYQLPRYESVKIDEIKWEEDPYSERYWRFNFYSLLPLNDLLFAYEKTNNPKYKDKAIELIDDFADNGINKEHSWDDNYGVAFRTINLINAWYELRQKNVLPIETNNKILSILEKHGEFLSQEEHYEPHFNHGIIEASALMLLSYNFPEFKDSSVRLDLSKIRLSEGLEYLVDNDGVLIENSPYYHFYTLEKYWEIYKYTEKNNLKISDSFMSRIEKMISYSAFILQPNLKVPTISASLEREISYSGLYKEMAKLDPNLQYVLTKGELGVVPKELNVQHPTAGQTIMRSGWGTGNDFLNQTQLIFNVGAYRTLHSHLDALSFNLFGDGSPLIVDSGLYTYEEGAMKNYFYGTSSHNTVVVDGKDQEKGKVTIGKSFESDGIYYQSAEHELYNGVSHQRAITLIEKNLVLIIDDLKSNTDHQYEQKFHLSPDLSTKINNLTVNSIDKSGNQKIKINQLISDGVSVKEVSGQQNPPDGLCSIEYEKSAPCSDISYSKKDKSAVFITAIEIGSDNGMSYSLSDDGKTINVVTKEKSYQIVINQTKESDAAIKVENNDKIVTKKNKNSLFDNTDGWRINDGKDQDLISNNGIKLINNNENKRIEIEKDINLNLLQKNIYLDMKEEKPSKTETFKLSFSNNNWASTADINLNSIYREEYSNTWLPVSLGLGELRNISSGGWQTTNKFDWSKIDKIKIIFSSDQDSVNSASVKNFSITNEQKEGSVVIIFDDGWKSIMPAFNLMEDNNIKGNIAAISSNIELRAKNYLSLKELKMMQDKGWDIANHSYYHKNALDEYISKGNTKGLEDDIVLGDRFLEDNGINSATNWYIYPNGATNNNIKDIVSKYYKFARTTQNAPESFPFGDNYGVKSLSVNSETTPEEVNKAISDAKKYNQTLFLTFHKISTATIAKDDLTSYYLTDFEKIVKKLKSENITVKTLSQLDKDNSIPLNKPIFIDKIPSQLELTINSKTIAKPVEHKKHLLINKRYSYLITYLIGGIILTILYSSRTKLRRTKKKHS